MSKKKGKKLRIRKNDVVKVIAGSSKNKIGRVLRVLPHKQSLIVEGINIKTKHYKASQGEETGKISQFEAPLHNSNVMLYSEKSGVASRIYYQVSESGKKERYLIKNREQIG